jgi:hypothetical protein
MEEIHEAHSLFFTANIKEMCTSDDIKQDLCHQLAEVFVFFATINQNITYEV